MVDLCFTRKHLEKKTWQTLTIASLALAAKHIEKDERKHYVKLLIEKSKLNIEAAAVVETENMLLKILNWKIPNFSVRHFLEGLLCIGFATDNDCV